MKVKTQRKIHFGNKSKFTHWGLIGCSHGASYGGYDNYWYGIKGLISVQIYKGWGGYRDSKI